MLTVIGEIRTRPANIIARRYLISLAKLVPVVLQEEGCHGYAPLVDHAAGVSFRALPRI